MPYCRIVPSEAYLQNHGSTELKQLLLIAFFFAALVAASPRLHAQQAPTPAPAQKQDNGNPFPVDLNSVPVMPSKDAPDLPPDTADSSLASVPAVDHDPVRSPDDNPVDDGASTSGFSSSRSGLDTIEPSPDDEPLGKHKKKEEVVPEHQETAKEDVTVGQYYLDNKNWRAAQSRYQSALVLDPENPDVYWGLAESARHLGDLAAARAYYEKVVDYDPGSHHAKDAAKALKDPDLANAKAASPTP